MFYMGVFVVLAGKTERDLKRVKKEVRNKRPGEIELFP